MAGITPAAKYNDFCSRFHFGSFVAVLVAVFRMDRRTKYSDLKYSDFLTIGTALGLPTGTSFVPRQT
jgi:hypothetical protein